MQSHLLELNFQGHWKFIICMTLIWYVNTAFYHLIQNIVKMLSQNSSFKAFSKKKDFQIYFWFSLFLWEFFQLTNIFWLLSLNFQRELKRNVMLSLYIFKCCDHKYPIATCAIGEHFVLINNALVCTWNTFLSYAECWNVYKK